MSKEVQREQKTRQEIQEAGKPEQGQGQGQGGDEAWERGAKAEET